MSSPLVILALNCAPPLYLTYDCSPFTVHCSLFTVLAERVGFEPTRELCGPLLDFESSAFIQLSHLSEGSGQ